MIRNPYANVLWESVHYIPSLSHTHLSNQTHLDTAYNHGIRHLAISNYHPSVPYYPLKDKFSNVPSDLIASPNAEHYGTTNSALHFNAIGSLKEWDGVGGTWRYGFDEVARESPYRCGITINHPTWTGSIPYTTIKAMIEHSPNVLGIEVFNAGCNGSMEHHPDLPIQRGWAVHTWDRLLTDGVYSLGFFGAPDHDIKKGVDWLGRQILLVDNKTQENCEDSYHSGASYGKMYNSDFKFTNIEANDNSVTVATNDGVQIEFITQLGKTIYSGNQATHKLTGDEMYVRIVAKDVSGDRLFSQPIQYSVINEKEKRKKVFMLL